MTRPLILVLALFVFVACDKKRKTPPAPGPTPEKTPEPAKKSTPAPKGVPQQLKDMVESKWPAIEAKGNEFVAEFERANKAKAAGDRASMDGAVDAASKAYKAAADMWAEVAYWPSNELNNDAQIETCDRFLRPWEKKVQAWTKKAKGLAQFQRVK